jgi:predicted phage terminase large subunit-like protein
MQFSNGLLDIVELQNAFDRLASRWKSDVVLVEDCSSGTQLVQLLRKRGGHTGPKVVPTLPRENKAERWFFQLRKFAEALVHVPRETDWLDVYIDELMRFPNGPFSDQVDSTSQFLRWMETPSWPLRLSPNEPPARRIVRVAGSSSSNTTFDSRGRALGWRVSRSMFPPKKS